jgi:cytochrome d ubiquinol oxidase subunit II
MDWYTLWFVLLGVLLAGYAVLDGFDLGVGIMHPLAQGDHQRRVMLNAIGPIWDGNEVWLVTYGGAMFAAFPETYRTVFSGFYTAFMLLLLCLIMRAVSIEFRSKVTTQGWRTVWDYGFFASSLVATLLFGVAIGNAMIGIPLDERGVYDQGLIPLVFPPHNPIYPLTIGVLAVALFALHGTLYTILKSEGDLQQRFQGYVWHAFGAFLVIYLFATIFTLAEVPRATKNFEDYPWAWAIVLLNILAIGNIPRCIYFKQHGQAFLSSTAVIACFVTLYGLALYPNMVTASNDPKHSLTIYSAASSIGTLKIMTLIAAMGLPFVLAYTAVIYWTFRGKVKLDAASY